jgi:hypothetical protein
MGAQCIDEKRLARGGVPSLEDFKDMRATGVNKSPLVEAVFYRGDQARKEFGEMSPGWIG